MTPALVAAATGAPLLRPEPWSAVALQKASSADILTKGVARAVFLQLIKLLDDYSVNSVAELTK